MRLFSAEEMAKLQLQQQKHQLRQIPQEWNLNYQLIQMNQLTVSATKLVTGRWLPVIIQMYLPSFPPTISKFFWWFESIS